MLLGVKRTSRFQDAVSAFDPKRTFRTQILTWIKFKIVERELSLITVACTRTGGSHGPAAESSALASPFLSLLHDRRSLCGRRWLAHSAPSLCRGARARNPYQGQCGVLANHGLQVARQCERVRGLRWQYCRFDRI